MQLGGTLMRGVPECVWICIFVAPACKAKRICGLSPTYFGRRQLCESIYTHHYSSFHREMCYYTFKQPLIPSRTPLTKNVATHPCEFSGVKHGLVLGCHKPSGALLEESKRAIVRAEKLGIYSWNRVKSNNGGGGFAGCVGGDLGIYILLIESVLE